MIIVIGRGHSGTRLLSHTLSASGVFMGSPLNASGDLVPPDAMYEACRLFGRHVRRTGEIAWDVAPLHTMDIPAEFRRLLNDYLHSVHASAATQKGWKIPETTLVFPWIARLFPDAHYIYVIRHPGDSILGPHLTDDLRAFGVDAPASDDTYFRRAVSWKYQYDIVKATAVPRRWIEVRFEDLVLDQDAALKPLERFLDIPLARVPVRKDSVGRWLTAQAPWRFDFLEPALRAYGYEPSAATAGTG